ncbi:MAG TPA: hypothetical protein VF525_05700 [Pyrinomonadaceae bacterium]
MRRRLLVKLLALGVLAVGVYALPTTPVSAQQGDECHSKCLTLDDGSPGCANYNEGLGTTCTMTFVRGRNVCSQKSCDGLII